MKKLLSFVLSILMILMLQPYPAAAERPSASQDPVPAESRVVLTIGDNSTRSGNRYNKDLGLWQYLADLVGVEIKYVYMSADDYAAGLASGDLPDIVATNKNLSTILENGVALDADPYLEEYCPNLLKGDARLAYDIFKKLGNEGGGFYFFPTKIGYNGVGFDNETSSRGYVVRWDYYKELGYPPINNEDDYLNVLLQMYEKHPFTEDGYPTYLYGTDNYTGYDTAFRSELSLDYWAPYRYQNNAFTNEVYDGYTDPVHSMWWASMEWENKLYRAGKADGSYDMDLFTQTLEQFDAKVSRGQYLGLHSTKSGLYKNKVRTDPDTLAGYNIVPTAATNFYTNVYQLLGNGPGYMWFISANSPHKKEALKLFNYMCDPDFVRELTLGRRGETWDYDADGVPRMNEYGQEQLDAYKAGSTDPDNYFVKWGSFDKMPSNWPLLRDSFPHPDGYLIDFATMTREYKKATMSNNISLDICEHYGAELPTDAVYEAGGLDFRNDCGEAISSCTSGLNREQLRILAEADEILEDIQVELILAETDEEWEAIRDRTIQKLVDLNEPEVFKAYQKIWNNAADVIVPLVRKAQSRNGIKSYTPGEYADRGAGTKEVSPSPEASAGSTGEGTQQAPRTPQESADPAGDGTKDAPQTPAESADSPSDGTEGQEP